MADEEIIVGIEYDTKQAEKNLDSLTEAINDVEKANTDLRKDLKKTDEELQQENKSRKDLSKSLELNRERLKDLKTERRASINVIKSEANSIKELQAQNKLLRAERDNLNLSTEEGRLKAKQLNRQIDENTDIIKANTDTTTKAKIGIGQYREGILGAVSAMDQLPGPVGQATQASKGLLQQFKALLRNPIGLILTALVGIVVGVGKAFKDTREGAEVFEKGMARIRSSFTVLKSETRAVTKNLVSLFKGDIGIKEFSKNMLEAKFNSKETLNQLVELEDQLISLRRVALDTGLELQKDISKLQKVSEVQRTIADDTTKSFEERSKAAREAQIASESAAQKQVELAKTQLEIADQELRIMEVSGEFNEQIVRARNDASIQLIEAEKNLTLTVRENEKQRAEIKQDRLERELDFIIDVFDSQKTVNERIIADDQRTFGERIELLEKTRDIADESFKQQISNIEQFTDKNIDVNKLLELNNQESIDYVRTLGLSEIIEGRVLEIVKERRFAVQDLADAEKDLNREMVERREEAMLKISEINEDRLTREAQTNEDLKSIQEQAALERFEFELENQTLLDEEKLALEIEYRDQLEQIQIEYEERERERINQLTDDTIDSFATILDAARDFKDQRIEFAHESFTALLELSKLEEATMADKFAFFGNLASSFLDLTLKNYDEELKALKSLKKNELKVLNDSIAQEKLLLRRQKQDGLITQEEFSEASLQLDELKSQKQSEIEKKFNDKIVEVKKKQFNQDKAQAVIDTVIQTAIAVAKSIAASPVTGGLPFSAIVGAIGAAQTALILSQQMPTFDSNQVFAQGGFVVGGKPHSLGGTKFFGSDGSRFEMEKGEGLFAMKKSATAELIALSRMNESFGGKSFFSTPTKFAQEGGGLDTSPAQLDPDAIGLAVSNALRDKIVVPIAGINQAVQIDNEVIEIGVIG